MAKMKVNFTSEDSAWTGNNVSFDGPYAVKTTKVETTEKGSLRITGQVMSENGKGASLSITIGSDFSKVGNRSKLLGYYASQGANLEAVKAKARSGDLDLDKTIGKTFYAFVTPKGEGEQYDKRDFLTKEQYEEQVKTYVPKPPAAAAAKGNGALADDDDAFNVVASTKGGVDQPSSALDDL
jgi:hypothetical protein